MLQELFFILMPFFDPKAPSGRENKDAYSLIVNAHLNEIYNFVFYMVSDRIEADDLTQKTFLSLYENLSKLDLSIPIKPWLIRVARNHCYDFLKKKKQLNFSEVEEQVLQIPENHPALEAKIDSQLFVEKFKQEVQKLPAGAKEVLLLKYFDDLTFGQISEVLGISVNTVKTHFYRGKSKLFQTIQF